MDLLLLLLVPICLVSAVWVLIAIAATGRNETAGRGPSGQRGGHRRR